MKTDFSLAQLADPALKDAEAILRSCVHCGFCTATCPTYTLLGDELDSPRGRIYLIKDMLENDRPATPEVVRHIDRCLSCLSCMTTCPSGVHYMHLVDHARVHVEKTHSRPLPDRLQRWMLSALLPRPGLFRLALIAARLVKPASGWLPARLKAMLDLAPRRVPLPSPIDRPQVVPAAGPRRKRVAILSGCAQPVLAPSVNEATVRLLARAGVEVVVAAGAGCCGALTHHMGKTDPAHRSALANIAAWTREIEGDGLDAIVINASGCGTTVKDYGHMFRHDPDWADKAARVSALARDITEFLDEHGLPAVSRPTGQVIAYHAACSLQHGQKVKAPPVALLSKAGFLVRGVPEAHLCCGSAGTYNLLQPELATQLRDRKVRNIESLRPDAVAAGNIGCITQIASGTGVPVVHTVELLDWATGGPLPVPLAGQAAFVPAGGGGVAKAPFLLTDVG
ncbi:glycolate oxidase subunit GlcF [Azospirillum sp. BE72]|uniref:glycolate oxidase subunit GlcF n=1 Tax=Azospirillum sp. BE72 TaxID=2817776 RepID=UPI002864C96E|nr:glycolate oxidase subunit GlcF [Azospirillum sp. BE72]MDR6773275.1 glycolate oxidase iron-sulfur subunit [Azospirillum sp. BE72]